ncbi:CBS domain-containing protein [Shinella kummerowiae]|jgi:Mg2+/Co2+ transporter CorB|uniref:CBS domain-containing protein n=1 Tax=Shinella kummerowiae TaxID=417745 RepID=A0A6N8SLZ7_9HYPH|nr:CBS domain-containing protein [Shinella kummerowiae]
MTGDTPTALAPFPWLLILLVLGLIPLAIMIFRSRTPLAALWRSHQETRETEGERRNGQTARDSTPNKSDREKAAGMLDLDALEVSDIMIHRTTMRALNAGDRPEEIVKAVLESPYTRMPLWSGSVDNIVGVVHAKDLLRALTVPGVEPKNLDITEVAQKPWFVPDTTTLKEQLAAFLRRKEHFATVVDEYGEVQGLVTLQDILKEIVGDISDEKDVDIQGVRQEADGSLVVDGSVSIRDLNRSFDWALPDEEATTIAGFVIHESKSIPEERQAFTFYGKRFIVMKRVKNRITKLRIRPVEPEPPRA